MAVIGELAVNVVAVTGALDAGLKRSASMISDFASKMGGLKLSAGGLAGAFGAAAAAAAGMAYAWRQSVDAIDQMNDAANKLNTTYNGLAQLELAAKLTGTEFGSLQTAIGNMNARLGEAAETGKGAAYDAIQKLGLSVNSLINMKSDQAFEQIADKLSRVDNAAIRTAMAMDIFGKAGKEIITTINAGSAGMDEMRRKAEALGLTLSDTAVKNAGEFNDQMDIAKAGASGWWRRKTGWATEAGVGALQAFNDVNNPNNRAWWDPTKWFSQTGTEAPGITAAERASFKPRYQTDGESSKAFKAMFGSAFEGIAGAIQKGGNSAVAGGSWLGDKIAAGNNWLGGVQSRMDAKQQAWDFYNNQIKEVASGGVSVGLNRAVDARTSEGMAYKAQLRKQDEQLNLMREQIQALKDIRDKIQRDELPPEIRTIP